MCFVVILALHTGHTGAQSALNFDSALHALQSVTPDTARYSAMLQFEKKINRSNPDKALILDSLMLGYANKMHNDTEVMKSLYRLSLKYNMLNDYPNAIGYSFKALEMATRLNKFDFLGEIYLAQSNIYKEINDTTKALECVNKALEIGRTHTDSVLIGAALNELGIEYDVAKQPAKAISSYKEAIKINSSLHDALAVVNSMVNMAVSFKNNSQFNEALTTYERATVIADSIHADYVKAVIIDNMANLYYAVGKFNESEKAAFEAILMSYQVEEKEIRVDMYNLLEKLYEKEKRYPEALAYFSKWVGIKDSLFNEERSFQISDLEQKYNTQLKDKQIETQQVQIADNKKLNIILGSAGFAVLLIACFIYYNQRKTARLNRTVSLQRDELAKQSEALSVMMKELHHRVKNNLQIVSSLLNLQSMKLTDEGAISAVQESKQRVQAMSLIHQRLYKTNDITRINMKEYIKELADFLATSYGYRPYNFTLELNAEEEWVDIDKALPLGLILNELLTNSFKYAFAGIKHPALQINFKKADGNLTLEIKDNGKGIKPGEWDDKRNTSFGRQLVKALCSQLRAKEKLEVVNGTSFTFTIPEAA